MNIISEGKRRRMISNREFARRSRVRKQKHQSLVEHLNNLLESHKWLVLEVIIRVSWSILNNLLESHQRAVDENARLKEETTDIKRKLVELQLAN